MRFRRNRSNSYNRERWEDMRNEMYRGWSEQGSPELMKSNLSLNNLNSKNIPAGAENIISTNAVEDGNIMANFHGEYGLGRYYTKPTVNHIMSTSGKNPFTRASINGNSITYYKAKLTTKSKTKSKTRSAPKRKKFRAQRRITFKRRGKK